MNEGRTSEAGVIGCLIGHFFLSFPFSSGKFNPVWGNWKHGAHFLLSWMLLNQQRLCNLFVGGKEVR